METKIVNMDRKFIFEKRDSKYVKTEEMFIGLC